MTRAINVHSHEAHRHGFTLQGSERAHNVGNAVGCKAAVVAAAGNGGAAYALKKANRAMPTPDRLLLSGPRMLAIASSALNRDAHAGARWRKNSAAIPQPTVNNRNVSPPVVASSGVNMVAEYGCTSPSRRGSPRNMGKGLSIIVSVQG